MWKFILFISLTIVAVWQLSIFYGNKQSVVKEKITEIKAANNTTKDTENVTVSSIEGSLQLHHMDEEETKVVKKEENKKDDVIKVSSSKDAFKTLNHKAGDVKNITYIDTKDKNKVENVDEYENLLTSEIENNTKIKEGEENRVEKPKDIGKKSDYENMLLSEMDDDIPNSDTTGKNTTNNSIQGADVRNQLEKLLKSAKAAIDKDTPLDVAIADDAIVDNAVKISNKSSKDLLNELVKNAANSKSSKESAYVANLLKEVSKSKITVVEVAEDYTTIIVKAGDSLSTIAKNIYGDSNKYHVIFEANKDKLESPNIISVGTVIKIPKL